MIVLFKKRKQLTTDHWSSFASRERRLFSVLRLYKAISVFPTNLTVIWFVICGFSVSVVSPEVVGCFLCQELISILLVSVRYLSKENFKWVFSGLHIRLFSVLPHWFVPEIGYNSYSANFNLFKDLKVEVCGFSLVVVLSLCSVTRFFFYQKHVRLRFCGFPICPNAPSRSQG